VIEDGRPGETGICNQNQIGSGYVPIGHAPVLHQAVQKCSTSMIAAVRNCRLMRFRLYQVALDVKIFIDIMKRLIRDAKQKVFLVVDNLRVYHAKKVRDWGGAEEGRHRDILSSGLRSGAHPGEYLNNDLKQQINSNPRPNDKKNSPRMHSQSALNPETSRLHQVILSRKPCPLCRWMVLQC